MTHDPGKGLFRFKLFYATQNKHITNISAVLLNATFYPRTLRFGFWTIAWRFASHATWGATTACDWLSDGVEVGIPLRAHRSECWIDNQLRMHIQEEPS